MSHAPIPWTPASWRERPAKQIPIYPDAAALAATEARLRSYPALVFEGEVERLRTRLAAAARGQAFLLQGGDCAESFDDFDGSGLRDNFRILLQMAIVLTFGAQKPIVKMGRVAGQFAKPRSEDFETRDGQSLPSYRGDIVNGYAFDAAARQPDPMRMETAYFRSAAKLNLLRAFAAGGFASLEEVRSWGLDFARRSPPGSRYNDLADRVTEALGFLEAVGGDAGPLRETEFYVSHESLLLPYEEALVRPSERRPAAHYSASAHFLWIGDRTRDLDGAHVEFLRGLRNPIGLKCGPTLDADSLLRLVDRLDPLNEAGRLTLITRFGEKKIASALPDLARHLQREGRNVLWCCDPMHGNTVRAGNGYKTRSFSAILSELRAFFEILRAEKSVPGGVHFELTGRDVVECLGGGQAISEGDLALGRYETLCDPRLNAGQALEMVFEICRWLR